MNDIEQRLVHDAQRIDVRHADTDGSVLAARIKATDNNTELPASRLPARRTTATWWLSGAMVSALIVLAVILIPQPADTTRDSSGDYTTPVAETQPTIEQPAATVDPMLLSQVSRAVALEEEWIAIQQDVARAKDQLEAAIPVGF
ncbi:MAG: hypothetical protein AAF004_10335 [Pseudomonadota bacterium]